MSSLSLEAKSNTASEVTDRTHTLFISDGLKGSADFLFEMIHVRRLLLVNEMLRVTHDPKASCHKLSSQLTARFGQLRSIQHNTVQIVGPATIQRSILFPDEFVDCLGGMTLCSISK